jgi:DNA polymerase-1
LSLYIQARAFDYHARPNDPRRQVVTTLSQFQWMMAVLLQQKSVAFDTETSGTAWYRHARICGYSFTCSPDGALQSWYVPFRHQTGELQLDEGLALRGCRDIVQNPNIEKICHNTKFDWHMVRADGIDMLGPRRDTMIEAALADENVPLALKMRAVVDLQRPDALVYEAILDNEVNRRVKESPYGKTEYKDRFGYSQLPIQTTGIYACFDTEFTWDLARLYDAKNVRTEFASTYELEIDLTGALIEMEENGLPLDVDYIHHLKRITEAAQDQLEPQVMHALGGYQFNLGSDDELRHVMSQRLGLKMWKKTKTGAMSVDKEVLEHFADDHPAMELILQWRQARKISTTYTDSILKSIGYDGLLHGDLRQLGTNTGRLSSSSPNLQNFAGDSDKRAIAHTGKSLEDGGFDPWSVKRAFVVRGEGWSRGYYDYSQIELRVLAHYSQDPTMIDVYLKGEDIHERTRLEVGGPDGKRRDAKIVNFGLAYCLSAKGFSRQAKIPLAEAEAFMLVFFERYPRIAPFRREFWAHVRQNDCFFQNLYGRPRRVPGMKNLDAYQRGRAERKAIGTLIQGTAAHLMKKSIVRLHKWNHQHNIGMKPCSTIHDEIQIDTPSQYFVEISRGVKHIMEDFHEFRPIVPETDVEVMTTNWAEKRGIAI